ncbi:MAG: ABC transporter ATP-binding protein [endosymbiont of Galathealinum brachiosum]|uniref:ABC transporter ATP-binding protein n=1 Tax=endosymbiont of Galathealinum brachiosum TaxID=2200906 RepID=A0A370DI77_9GAMM|nr:MAG: ABC transporter ATP-binding protein [endosymbiont of Galathealinum brachiosum]
MQAENNQKVIEVSDLITHYGSKKILNSVSLEVNKGEIMVIMGGSGSGKSTLLRYMLGLNKPTAGSIKLLGKDITRMTSNQLHQMKKQIGVSFQGGALFGSMSVSENIQLPLSEHANLDENTMRIMSQMKLEVVNMAGFEDLMPSQLSGGMIKRAALARAIILDPKLLFFDEPSAGLDPVVSAELDELILRLRDAMGMTIVVVTHELESAFNIADRITILDRGDILMCGTVEEVKNSDNHRIYNLLHRKPRRDIVDVDEYLQRLTGKSLDSVPEKSNLINPNHSRY